MGMFTGGHWGREVEGRAVETGGREAVVVSGAAVVEVVVMGRQ